MREVFISASLACADFGYLADTMRKLEEVGVAFFHFDVVDGHFAPTFIVGPPVLASLRKYSQIPFEAHLACWQPERYIEQFVEAGADYIAYHLEATEKPESLADTIREKGARPVLALCPETPAEAVSDALLEKVNMVLVLTVHPGFAGQKFIPETVGKIQKLAQRIRFLRTHCLIEADGNICEDTVPNVVRAGARVLIGGTSGLFRKDWSFGESVAILKRQAYDTPEEEVMMGTQP